MKTMFAIALMCIGSLCVQSLRAEDEKPVKPDNTAINERDRARSDLNPTADQQGQSKPDVELTAKIRQAVVKDESLSHTAHNVKIITVNGMVTLRGPVKTEAEKTNVEKKAAELAGEKNVKSEIEIAK